MAGLQKASLRYKPILLQLGREILPLLAVTLLCTLIGVGILLASIALKLESAATLGEIIILAGTCYASWHVITATIRAIIRIQQVSAAPLK